MLAKRSHRLKSRSVATGTDFMVNKATLTDGVTETVGRNVRFG